MVSIFRFLVLAQVVRKEGGKDLEELIKKLEKKYEEAQQISAQVGNVHDAVYLKVAHKHGIIDETTGKENYKLLKDKSKLDAFVKDLKKEFTSRAQKQYEKVWPNMNSYEKDRLTKFLYGLSEDEIESHVRKKRHGYTKGYHAALKDNILEKLEAEHQEIVFAPVRDENAPGIIELYAERLGLDKDAIKKITREEAKHILSTHYKTKKQAVPAEYKA